MGNNDGKTFGNAWMHSMLIKLLKHTNIRILYVVMSIFVIPITLVFSPGAKLTFRYFRKKKRLGRWKSVWETYCNHVIFGQTVIDKFAMFAGNKFRVTYYGLEEFERLAHLPQAMMQLSAHIGCSEIVGYMYNNDKPSNVLVYGGEKDEYMNLRRTAFGKMNMRMIPVGTNEMHSDDIIRALDNGEIIYAFADRFYSTNKYVISTLHGHKIKLAKGPFSMAVTRGLNVVLTSAMKEPDGSYSAYLVPLHYDKSLNLREQRQQLADSYTAEIEKLLKKYPRQWFNYSDIWVS